MRRLVRPSLLIAIISIALTVSANGQYSGPSVTDFDRKRDRLYDCKLQHRSKLKDEFRIAVWLSGAAKRSKSQGTLSGKNIIKVFDETQISKPDKKYSVRDYWPNYVTIVQDRGGPFFWAMRISSDRANARVIRASAEVGGFQRGLEGISKNKVWDFPDANFEGTCELKFEGPEGLEQRI
jgi:hypothetical protein